MDKEIGTLLTAQIITDMDAVGPTNSIRKNSSSYYWTLVSLCS